MAATGAQARPLRVDAARNRARILEAAAEVFADRGLDVTLDDIAAHAGLGVGTVYRRFADREALVEALFDERMQQEVERTKLALDTPEAEAWDALIDVLRQICQDFARDRGMRQVMLSTVHGHGRVAQCREEMREVVESLVQRAKATGKLRPEFETSDVPLLLLMLSTVADFSSVIAPGLWERYFDMLVDGMRTQPPDAAGLASSEGIYAVKEALCARALGLEELTSAMDRWRPTTLR